MSRLRIRVFGKGIHGADILNRTQLLNFLGSATAGQTATILPGLSISSVDLSASPRTIGATPITIKSLVPGSPWYITTTGNTPALNLAGWSGVSVEDLDASNDEVGSTTFYIVNFNNTQYMTLRRSYVHGAEQQTHGGGECVHFASANDLLIDRCKFRRVNFAVHGIDASRITIQDCYFHNIESDGIRSDTTAKNGQIADWSATRCLYEDPTPIYSGGTYTDHADFWQFLNGNGSSTGTDGTVVFQRMSVTDCMVMCTGGDGSRAQGPFWTTPSGNYCSNLTLTRVISMGTLPSGIALAGLTGANNILDGCEVYNQSGSTQAKVNMLFGNASVATYKNCNGQIANSGGTSILTDGGGNVNSGINQSLTLTTAQMQTKRDTFRASFTNIPS